MNVSQFLKSFKKNLAAKAKCGASERQANERTTAHGDEDVSDGFRSASDEAEEEAEDEEVILGGRSEKLAGKRYATKTSCSNRNREFPSLKVVETNSTRAVEMGHFQRQRAVMARQARSTQKRPRAEVVAAVRAELLRQREQLHASHVSDSANVLDAPVEKMQITMIEVEDLLQASAPTAPTCASVLDFLPATPLPAAHQATSTTASSVVSTATATNEQQQPPNPATSLTAVAPLESGASVEGSPQLPKKRSKFELAMTLVRDDATT
ncbi:hypothetical protein, conserved [Leishmania lindenbergi]|uniref:Uncharacterized protein n=1 Tax=Leishmania lindenbergi TaxID=651832 RepID=A0AAW3ABU6_9TRYP